MLDIFKSASHKQRWLSAIREMGKYDGDKADPEYGAALFVLTADPETWERTQEYVKRDGIDFDGMLEREDWSGGYQVLIRCAANLFNGTQQVGPVELLRLDESNFILAFAALQVRRYGLRLERL